MNLSDRYLEAINLAFELHRNDQRKGKATPYMAHLLSVSALVLEDGGSEDEAIAALLHDTLEDHPEKISFSDIAERFGEFVANIVMACTDTPEDFSGGVKPPWKQRKQSYLDHLSEVPQEVLRVAMADKLHNVRDIRNDLSLHGERVWDRFNAEKAEQIWFFKKLLKIFSERLPGSSMLLQYKEILDELKSEGCDRRIEDWRS
jgi:(p)ppGpp synthase/HD superfamily hydrolase